MPLLESEGPFRKQAEYRHKCGMAAIEVEANTKIRNSLLGRSRPVRVDYVPGEMHYTTGEQIKESISRKDTGWDPQESLVLKAAICGCHMEQQRPHVRKNKFGWHHLLKRKSEK